MNKETNSRNESIHLYNPKKEGWLSYDINYINAFRKKRNTKDKSKASNKNNKRYAA